VAHFALGFHSLARRCASLAGHLHPSSCTLEIGVGAIGLEGVAAPTKESTTLPPMTTITIATDSLFVRWSSCLAKSLRLIFAVPSLPTHRA
jgi:hypothetical protein